MDNTGIKKVSDSTKAEINRLNTMSDAALSKEARDSATKDRPVNETEKEVYSNVKNQLNGVPLGELPNLIKDISKNVGSGDGVGAAAVAIADRFFPNTEADAAILNTVHSMENKEMNPDSNELYDDATYGYEVDSMKQSDGYKSAKLNKEMKTALAMVAGTVIDLNNSKKTNTSDDLGVMGDEAVKSASGVSPSELDELPPLFGEPPKKEVVGVNHNHANSSGNQDSHPLFTVPDPTDNGGIPVPAKKQPVFDVAKTRADNASRRAKSRLGNNVKVNGSEITGYFPYSNLKFKMDPTNSILDTEEDFNELDKMYQSEGLNNMSKFITSASKHVTLVTGDSDADIINPGDKLRQKLNFMDYKYLLIAKALSSNEHVLNVEVTCPHCMKEYAVDLDVRTCLALFPEVFQKAHDEYDGSKKYDELTENWRTKETANIVKKLDAPILDEFEKKYFDKIVYTLNFTEPTIDKYMRIKESAIALLTFIFREQITQEMIKNEVTLLTSLYDSNPERVARIQSIMESFTILDSITTSYYDTKSGSDVLIITDEIKIEDNLDITELYDLITVQLSVDILAEARKYLMDKYKLDDIRNMLAQRAQVAVDEVPMPTLLDEMIQISIEGLTCKECGESHNAEASVLFLGFSLAEKSMLKIRV